MVMILKFIGVVIVVFFFSAFTIAVGVEIALRAYFNHRNDSTRVE